MEHFILTAEWRRLRKTAFTLGNIRAVTADWQASHDTIKRSDAEAVGGEAVEE